MPHVSYPAPGGAWNALRLALGFIVLGIWMHLKPWRVLPKGHPTRIFIEGRTTVSAPIMRQTLSPSCPRTWVLVLLAATFVIGLILAVDSAAHTLTLNPFEDIISPGWPSIKPLGDHLHAPPHG